MQSAYEWIAQPQASKYADVAVHADEPKRGGRGVVLREAGVARAKQEVEMRVCAVFAKSASNERKAAFERRIRIRCTVPWLCAPSALLLTNGERRVNVLIDPTHTQEGCTAFGEVQGFDEDEAPNAGPLFRFPVTVIQPAAVGAQFSQDLTLETAKLQRFFFTVPHVRPLLHEDRIEALTAIRALPL